MVMDKYKLWVNTNLEWDESKSFSEEYIQQEMLKYLFTDQSDIVYAPKVLLSNTSHRSRGGSGHL